MLYGVAVCSGVAYALLCGMALASVEIISISSISGMRFARAEGHDLLYNMCYCLIFWTLYANVL